MDALLTLLGKADNIAVLVLIGVCAGLGYLHVIWRKEERDDRRRLYDVVESNTRAVEVLRMALSVLTGKVL